MSAPIRALHVVGYMAREGVQTWLLNVMRQLPRADVAIDLMVHVDAPAAYDGDVEATGATIHHNPHRDFVTYVRRMHRLLSRGSYDVVHSHVHHFSGVVLTVARRAGVPVRIAHSHSDTNATDAAGSWTRRAYLKTTSHLIRRSATAGFACSDPAGRALFGPRWSEDRRWSIMHAGIEPALRPEPADRDGVRCEFGLPMDATLVTHVGRFDPVKNQRFLLEVIAVLRTKDPRAVLLLVGTGPLEAALSAEARARGLDGSVRFCGMRTDVPRLLAASDVFVFPSLFEGAPLACLEAQAAGLPLVMADTIDPGVIVTPEWVVQLPLDSASPWADAIVRATRNKPDAYRALEAVRRSPFNVTANGTMLLDCYRAGLTGTAARTDAADRVVVGV